MGDMASFRADGLFEVVYLVFNTIGNVETQDRQVACFANAAAHLEPGGAFVIELVVPDLRRLVPGHDAVVFAHGPGYVGYDRYDDVVAQHAVSHHFIDDGSGAPEFPTPFRFVWPPELDPLAWPGGLSLRARRGTWNTPPLPPQS